MKKKLKKKNIKGKKYVYLAALCALSAAIVYQALSLWGNAAAKVSTEVIDWGVSYQSEGESPVGNADNDMLLTYGACFRSADESSKTVYLTFDAGYENGYTESILNALSEAEVPAAFFLTGNYFKEETQLVQRMFDEGHLVCNHTLNHPDTTLLTKDQFDEQLTSVEKLCEEIYSRPLNKYYRPPSGRFNTDTLKYAAELGYKSVLWSVTYADWDNDAQKSAEEAMTTLMKRAHNGAVILLHATSRTNSEILTDYINAMRQEGYEFESLDTLF